jgi:hypothetical protein
MNQVPGRIRPGLKRLERQLAVGLFLDVWPAWAIGSLLAAGVIALTCRLFFPAAAPYLAWLWLAPALSSIPAVIACVVQRYRPHEIVALADSLGGGQGVLLTLTERDDPGWAESPLVDRSLKFGLPRLRPWRRLSALPAAAAFLSIGLWLPQRMPSADPGALADDIAGGLASTLEQLKQQDLVTPEDEQKLEEEIERIRRAAEERVDGSSWEAADAVREKMVTAVAAKQDAVKWAQDALRRYAAAAQGGGAGAQADAKAEAAELAEAIGKLAENGLLAGAPPEFQRRLRAGRLPTDPQALRDLVNSLSEYLGEANGRIGSLAKLGKEFGRFDPAEFPLDPGADGAGNPGRGGLDRGRADAELTWGNESLPIDRFKSAPLPPGAARSADDWAPVVEAPGAPSEAPVASTTSAARQYADSAGQSAWRRTLAPRHQRAVKKYFGEPAKQ